jgi:hypothetical protein
VLVDVERLRERALQLRNQAEWDLDQAGALDTPVARKMRATARESVFVAYALMLVAEVVEATEDEAA